jgi:hypothetical protein
VRHEKGYHKTKKSELSKTAILNMLKQAVPMTKKLLMKCCQRPLARLGTGCMDGRAGEHLHRRKANKLLKEISAAEMSR